MHNRKMNRKKLNGPVTIRIEQPMQSKVKNEFENNSNSTDSFDMNEFKSTSLTKKYSVQIHKNNADLMAELDSINIMGDESDVEVIEPKTEQNGLSVSANVSKETCMNTTHSTDGRINGEFECEKHERVLAWAQSQSQNLSMCVASVLSDHDYLSQELLLGIIAGNEENTENQREMESKNIVNDEKEGTEQLNGEVDKKITENQNEANGTAAAEASASHSSNEKLNSINVDDLDGILKQLTNSKEHAQSLSLLEQIEEKAKQMREKLNDEAQINKTNENNKTTESNPEFSSGHSEPLEYHGGVKFSAQSSVDDAKESEGNEKFWLHLNEFFFVVIFAIY